MIHRPFVLSQRISGHEARRPHADKITKQYTNVAYGHGLNPVLNPDANAKNRATNQMSVCTGIVSTLGRFSRMHADDHGNQLATANLLIDLKVTR